MEITSIPKFCGILVKPERFLDKNNRIAWCELVACSVGRTRAPQGDVEIQIDDDYDGIWDRNETHQFGSCGKGEVCCMEVLNYYRCEIKDTTTRPSLKCGEYRDPRDENGNQIVDSISDDKEDDVTNWGDVLTSYDFTRFSAEEICGPGASIEWSRYGICEIFGCGAGRTEMDVIPEDKGGKYCGPMQSCCRPVSEKEIWSMNTTAVTPLLFRGNVSGSLSIMIGR
jgi:hypothetical protein